MLQSLLTLILLLLAACAAVVLAAFFWRWHYWSPTGEDEVHFFSTKDGWRLALHRYRPADGSRGYPVILCHGLSSNRFIFELAGAPSLAKHLSDAGWDVWVAELRGSGMSAKPGLLSSDVPYFWGIEDHLREDVPAIIGRVLELTSAERVHWVGHSMGGMLIAGHLSATEDDRIASAVTVGSPMDFSNHSSKTVTILMKLSPYFETCPVFPPQLAARAMAPLAPTAPFDANGLFCATNIERTISRKAIALCSEPVTSCKIWLEFGRFVRDGSLSSSDGRVYLERLPQSRVPILAICGSVDCLAPPESMRGPMKASDGVERKMVVFGRRTGSADEYGHMDLVLGKRADQEVFPVIAGWLQEHDPVYKTDA